MLARVVGRGLRRVDRRAAAARDDRVDLVLRDDLLHLLDLALAGDAAEDLPATVLRAVAEALLDLVVAGLVAALGTDEEPALAHVAHLFLELEQGTLPLDVLQGLTHGTKQLHSDLLPSGGASSHALGLPPACVGGRLTSPILTGSKRVNNSPPLMIKPCHTGVTIGP